MVLRRRARVLLAVAFGAGCANYSPRVRPDEKPNPALAYLYGRFFVKAVGKEGSLAAYPSLGIVIGCNNRQEYTIKFVNARDVVQVLPAWPSRCAIVRVFRTDENGIMRPGGDVDLGAGVSVNDFQAGKAYYLGDYFAKAGIDYTYQNDRLKRYRAWNMSPVDGRYESTTADMKRLFPGLASLPTEDKQLVLQRKTSKPGAVVVNDADEPLMTPERIARIAPFVKRTYASPAECEAACSTGQCLPFRSEAGAAMTCIVRCNVDKDCPEGSACNCPGGAAADCPAVVETPKDKMAKICLSTERGGQRR